jgi:uncharacterized membrane protein
MILFAALAIPILLAAQLHDNNFRHYKLIDIGTFGGPASYINAAFAAGAPNQINNRGTVVGSAATDTPAPPNRQICGGIDGIVPFIFHAFAWQNGELTDLGALGASPGIECSQADSINANGEIAGISGNGVFDPLIGVEEIRAVVWKDGEIRDLGSLGGNLSAAMVINNRSEVIGISANAVPDPFSLAGVGTQVRGILWDKGKMRDLGTLGGPDTNAFGLNERGQVTGNSYIDSTPNSITGLPTSDPFLWTEERGMIDLGTLGGVWGGAGLVNNRAQVVGSSSLAADPGACLGIGNTANCHPFVWDDGKLTDLTTETIGGNPITANALNDAGEIVGTAGFPGRPFSDAYLWSKGVAMDIGTMDDDCFSEAFAINSRNQIVGQSFSCVSNSIRTFLWENGSIVDLNALVSPNSSLQLVEAFAINDRGEIGGIGNPPGCLRDDACGHAYVLIPICADGNEGCVDAPLEPAVVAHSRAASGAAPKTMTPEELATFKEGIARMHAWTAARNRGFGLWPRR